MKRPRKRRRRIGPGRFRSWTILGHRHPATTARYAHLDDDPRRAAAALISNQIAADLNGQPAGEVIPFKKP